MNLQPKFNRFNSNIKLNYKDEAYADIKSKGESILKEIKKKCTEEGYPVKDDFQQGSFATHTSIKSLDGDYDLDWGVVFDREEADEDPVILKKIIRDVLTNRGFKEAKIKIPCVTADYKNLKLHIDYPIYQHSNICGHELGVGKEHSKEKNKKWQQGNPKGLIDWVNSKDNVSYTTEQKDQYRRLIRFMKRWRDHNFSDTDRKKVYSIGLTVMVIECYKGVFEDGSPKDLQSMTDTVSAILNHHYFSLRTFDEKYDIEVRTPVMPKRDIFEKHGTTVGTTLRNKLLKLKEDLEKASEQESEKDACDILRKLLGEDFPEGSDVDNKGKARATHASAGIVPNIGGA